MNSNGKNAEETDWSDGGIPAVLQASTETSLKFACLVRFIEASHVSRKEILESVLYLVTFLFLKTRKKIWTIVERNVRAPCVMKTSL